MGVVARSAGRGVKRQTGLAAQDRSSLSLPARRIPAVYEQRRVSEVL